MKQIFSVLLVLMISVVSAQEIKWMSMNEALSAQKKNPKKIFVDVYTAWCGPCKMLSEKTFKNKDLVKYINDKFYAVKFNAEGNEDISYKGVTYKNNNYDPAKANTRNGMHDFAGALGVSAYPTMLVFDEKSAPIFPITGYLTATQLEPIIKFLGENTYLTVTTQEAYDKYMKNFKGTFKN
ncbi:MULTISPECIES: thioredoxin family protein [unclassified Capnocytophaga]|uniref:thioredoxin family protein n=1 Tax=unclassified Capnocytophaga TaxID=2640652 RepID=UPI000202B317|nr:MULTISPECIES: thioredoxin family protein [unclassified Capnocytophaga]EGD34070.1 hypothetical protein HMPREF9071_1340 [Capnocytophaga sp. oral taxon 338 str. F0234]MEB3004782.1 thioredoxin family protein [Capnocytophaga sp. G2]